MERQPDPLQPDDQHELQPTAGDRGEQRRQHAGGERPDAEQHEIDHRGRNAQFDQEERDEEQEAKAQFGEYTRAAPGHQVAAIRLDAVVDADEDQDEADGEGDVAPPVEPAVLLLDAHVLEAEIRPHRADDADWNVDPEDQVPVDVGQEAADDEPEELPGNCRHDVDAEREAALFGRKHVDQDCRRRRGQHGAADPLHHPHAHEEPAGPVAGRHETQNDRRQGENEEAEIVDLGPAEHVAEPAESHHQDGGDHHVAHKGPQQDVGVAGVKRPEPDAAKDCRQADQHDRGVDRGGQHAQRRIAQHHPFVVLHFGRHRDIRATGSRIAARTSTI